MKNKIVLPAIFLFLSILSFGQNKKLIETFNSTMIPSTEKEDVSDISYSITLKEKYGIRFEAIKINSLSSGDCVFNTDVDGNYQSAEVSLNETFPYEIIDDSKKYIAEVTYSSYTPNKKNPNAASVTVLVNVYSLGNDISLNSFALTIPDNVNKTNKVSLWATQYYVHKANYSSTGFPLKSKDGKTIFTKIEICDWCDAAVEGTIFTKDSLGNDLTLNYAGKGKFEQVDCSKCKKYSKYTNKGIRYSLWYKANGKFGDGVQGYILVPYRTIAVDKKIIPIGTVIFIPDAVGKEITLPNGEIMLHDGYFFSADIGGDIKGNHIDVFTGEFKSKSFGFIKSDAKGTFDAYIIDNLELKNQLIKMHKK